MKTDGTRWSLMWAAVDQACFAGASFVGSVIIARRVPPEIFGQFVVTQAAFLAAATLHIAFVSEPALVVGPSRFGHVKRAYTLNLLKLQSIGGIVAGVLMLTAGSFMGMRGDPALAASLIACGLATPFMLTLWTARRIAYMRREPALAGVASATHLSLTTVGLLSLDLQTAAQPFAVLGMSASIASLVILSIVLRHSGGGEPPLSLLHVARAHWSIGRWAAPAALFKWVPDNAFIVVIPFWYGVTAAASLRVTLLMILPLTNLMTAVALLLLPSLAANRRLEDGQKFVGTMRRAAKGLFAVLACYSVALLSTGELTTHLVFGDQYAVPLVSMAVALSTGLPMVLYVVYGHALRAVEAYRAVLLSYLLGVVSVLVVGLPLTYALGTNGAILGILAAYAAISAAMRHQFRPHWLARMGPSTR